jgi:hypothetical protein
VLVGAEALAAAPPEFDGESEAHSQNGAMLLSWDEQASPGELEYELQEAGDPAFSDAALRYRGEFPSFFISGRRDGTRYFRIRSRSPVPRSQWSEWSTTKAVVVEHHDLGAALGLFGGGAAVFLATCLALVAGSSASRREQE